MCVCYFCLVREKCKCLTSKVPIEDGFGVSGGVDFGQCHVDKVPFLALGVGGDV